MRASFLFFWLTGCFVEPTITCTCGEERTTGATDFDTRHFSCDGGDETVWMAERLDACEGEPTCGCECDRAECLEF